MICKINVDENKLREAIEIKKVKKPPLGIMPCYIWKLKRKEDLKGAIHRYIEAGLKVNQKWIEEYNSYVEGSKIND